MCDEWLIVYMYYPFQGRVVRKPVNANPGLALKVNRGNNFTCRKVFSIVYILCSLRLLMLKLKGKKYKQNSLLKSYKNQIKILAYLRT